MISLCQPSRRKEVKQFMDQSTSHTEAESLSINITECDIFNSYINMTIKQKISIIAL